MVTIIAAATIMLKTKSHSTNHRSYRVICKQLQLHLFTRSSIAYKWTEHGLTMNYNHYCALWTIPNWVANRIARMVMKQERINCKKLVIFSKHQRKELYLKLSATHSPSMALQSYRIQEPHTLLPPFQTFTAWTHHATSTEFNHQHFPHIILLKRKFHFVFMNCYFG